MSVLTVAENNTPLTFTYDDFVKYHGFKSPCGLSQSFKVLELETRKNRVFHGLVA